MADKKGYDPLVDQDSKSTSCGTCCLICVLSLPISCYACLCSFFCLTASFCSALMLLPGVICFLPMGINGVPFGYQLALLYKGGLLPLPERMSCSDQVWTVVSGWDNVTEAGALVPGKQWSGEWWRGNELGYVVNNPVFWSAEGIWPQANTIGVLPSQHTVLRPFYMQAFFVNDTNRAEIKSFVRQSVRSFFAEKLAAGELKVQEDVLAWVHTVLFKLAFGKEVDKNTTADFLKVQKAVVQMGTVSWLFPSFLYKLLKPTVQSKAGFVGRYMKLVEEKYGDQLVGMDCSPSANCTVQLASGFFDALYSAGGLSVPQAIGSGIAVLYTTSDDTPNGTKGFTMPKGKEAEFFWEVMRLMPPVLGYPQWTTRPKCYDGTAEETAALNFSDGKTKACKKTPAGPAGYPSTNQYSGGHRLVIDLPSAQRDPEKWGEGANHSFRLRPLEDYEKLNRGFAEMSVDKSVANGNMDRVCPGKELALIMGTIWFEEMDLAKWVPVDSDIAILPYQGPRAVKAFVLKSKNSTTISV